MKTSLLYIFNVILFSNILFSQGKSDGFTVDELEGFVKSIVMTQMQYDNFYDGYMNLKKSIGDKEYVKLNYISCQIVSINPFVNSLLKVFKCTHAGAFNGGSYVVAISWSGFSYLLRGFKEQDFDRMIKEKIGIVETSDVAAQLAIFYLESVMSLSPEYIVSNEEQIAKYSGGVSHLYLPVVTKNDEGYKVVLMTVAENYNSTGELSSYNVLKHQVIITSDGHFAHDSMQEEQ